MKMIRIYSQDIGMEFSIEKCAMLVIKWRKREEIEGIELPNPESTRIFGEKENNKVTSAWEYLKQISANKQKWKKN